MIANWDVARGPSTRIALAGLEVHAKSTTKQESIGGAVDGASVQHPGNVVLPKIFLQASTLCNVRNKSCLGMYRLHGMVLRSTQSLEPARDSL